MPVTEIYDLSMLLPARCHRDEPARNDLYLQTLIESQEAISGHY